MTQQLNQGLVFIRLLVSLLLLSRRSEVAESRISWLHGRTFILMSGTTCWFFVIDLEFNY